MVVFSLPEYKGACIYLILSPNDKPYTGQTVAFLQRMTSHKSQGKLAKVNHAKWKADKNKKKVCAISFGIHKHGWENMKIIILEKFSEWTQQLLDEREKHFIRVYDSYKKGYNCNEGGNGNSGFKHSEETKAKWSAMRKGINTSPTKPITSCKIKKEYPDGTQLVKYVFYASAAEAERKTGIKQTNISKCCHKQKKSSGARFWHFREDDDVEGEHRVPRIGDVPRYHKRPLFSESREGEKLLHWGSGAAEKTLTKLTGKKFSHAHISSCCRGKRKSHCKYKFYWATPEMIEEFEKEHASKKRKRE